MQQECRSPLGLIMDRDLEKILSLKPLISHWLFLSRLSIVIGGKLVINPVTHSKATQIIFSSLPEGILELLNQQRYHFWRPPACSRGGKGASVWPIREKLPLGCPGVHCCQGLSTLRCQGAETRCYRDASESSSGGWVWKGGPRSVTPEWLIRGLISYLINSMKLAIRNTHKPH